MQATQRCRQKLRPLAPLRRPGVEPPRHRSLTVLIALGNRAATLAALAGFAPRRRLRDEKQATTICLMAIRFQCPACAQPIEVDDDLARNVVACPYCRKTVTAPSESTLRDPGQVPVAAPSASPVAALERPDYGPGPRGNALAVVSFVLACGVLILYFVVVTIAVKHRIELEELMKEISDAGGGFAGQFQAMNEYAQESGGTFPAWFLAIGFLTLAAMCTWVAGLVCGLIAVRRPERRGFAVAALLMLMLYLLLNCGGTCLAP